MNFKDHNQNLLIIGKIFLVIGLLLVPIAVFSFFFRESFSGFDFEMDSDDIHFLFLTIRDPFNISYFFPVFYSFLSIVFIVSGVGLTKKTSWARFMAWVPAVLLLFKFPIGTALAIYLIYALHITQEEAVSV